MEKNDFVVQLLKNKFLSNDQLLRILRLMGKSAVANLNGLENLDLKTIKTKFEENLIIEKDNDKALTNTSEDYDDLPIYIDPCHLYKYLFSYNQNRVLKSTCHKIDRSEFEDILQYCAIEEYDFQVHRKKVIEEFEIHDKKFAPASMKNLIRVYITGCEYGKKKLLSWSSLKIETTWSSEDLELWCLKNPNLVPSPDEGFMEETKNIGFELSQPIRIQSGKDQLKTFSDLIVHFKRLFHIRSDNSFKKMIGEINSGPYWKGKIEFEDNELPKNIEFFTDVDKLRQSYYKILGIIEKNGVLPKKVKVFLLEYDDRVEFCILDKDVYYAKSLNNVTERLGKEYRHLIKKGINGICNFYVRADFEGEGAFQIGIWDKADLWKKKPPKPIKLKESVGGVMHVFELTKSARK
jgi:hypothetical protein